MANFNLSNITVAGRLTADAESVQTQTGTVITNFDIARNHQQGEEKTTSFFKCVAYGEKKADFLNEYFKKGDAICVTGEMRQRSWTDNDGNKRSVYEIVVDNIFFVDSKAEKTAQNDQPTQQESEKKTTRKYSKK